MWNYEFTDVTCDKTKFKLSTEMKNIIKATLNYQSDQLVSGKVKNKIMKRICDIAYNANTYTYCASTPQRGNES